MVFARYFMSTLLPLELNCPFSDCRVRLSSVDLVQEHIAARHSDEFDIYSPSVEMYLGQIEALMREDKIFRSLFSLATTITDEYASEPDGSCSVHECGNDGECILDIATMDGVQVLTDMFTSEVATFTIRCAQARSQLSASVATTESPNSAPNNLSMRRVTLSSPEVDHNSIEVRLKEAMDSVRIKAQKLRSELKVCTNQVCALAMYTTNTANVRAKCIEHVGQSFNGDFKSLYTGKSMLSVLKTTGKDYTAVVKKLGAHRPTSMRLETSRIAAAQYRHVGRSRQERQKAQKQSQASHSLANVSRSWQAQASSRGEEETQEQYCDRRWQELSRCSNPELSDLQDYEQCPAAAVVLWYKQANLRTRHEPPACVTEDVIMLHGLNLMEFDSWTDSDMKILQACKTFNTIVHDAHWLQVAADLMHMCDNGYHEISMEGASGGSQMARSEVSRNNRVLYRQLRVKILSRVRLWCRQDINVDTCSSSSGQQSHNLSSSFVAKHRTYQAQVLQHLEECERDAGRLNAARPSPDVNHDHTVDGEMFANYTYVLESLQSHGAQYHDVFSSSDQISRDHLDNMITECLHRRFPLEYRNLPMTSVFQIKITCQTLCLSLTVPNCP